MMRLRVILRLISSVWIWNVLFGVDVQASPHLGQARTHGPGNQKKSAFFPSADPVGLSPHWDWKTLESPHFRISFPIELLQIAQRSVTLLEEAHRSLTPVFKSAPSDRVQVLLIDNTDSANGLTAPIAEVGIVLWVTPPETWFSTSYYDDWLRFLIFHEYTHFVNIDSAEGLWSVAKTIFGNTAFPNGTWYPWMLEGLAVYMETRWSTAGRGRSPYYDMVLRAAVDEGVLDHPQFMTLDKMGGSNPYFPGGDTRYLFGYQLMNQVAITARKPYSSPLDFDPGTEMLGDYSKVSGGGLPFLYNAYISQVSGKDWSDHWGDFVSQTKGRVTQDLKKIRSQPVTSVEWITDAEHEISNEVRGIAASADGQWLAYNLFSADRREGLILKNLKTGQEQRILDRYQGVGLSFTRDSKALFWSAIRKTGQYFQYSELMVHDLETHQTAQLTELGRFRDPDVSGDGKWLIATQGKPGLTKLVLLPLHHEDHKYSVGGPIELFVPEAYGHVANPKFSPGFADGTGEIYFSLHRNGKSQEDLMQVSVVKGRTSQVKTVFSDGFYNRYPTFSPAGDLYFVSNATGADNLYRYRQNASPQLVSNVTTGLAFPVFDRSVLKGEPVYFASVFSTRGWNLARMKALSSIETKKVEIAPPPAPPLLSVVPAAPSVSSTSSTSAAPTGEAQLKSYSPWASLFPRLWIPSVGLGSSGYFAEAQVLGFDAIDEHRYYLDAQYDSGLNQPSGSLIYSNRAFGPSFEFIAETIFGIASLNSQTVFAQEASLSATVSYPWIWTYSSLVPSLGVRLTRDFYYGTTVGSLQSAASVAVNSASLDASLVFQNLERSNLGIIPEGGRIAQVGLRAFPNPEIASQKLFFREEEFLRLTKHVILNPAIRGLWSTTSGSTVQGANALLKGRSTRQLMADFPADGLDQVTIRGYPGVAFLSRGVVVGSVDLVFPLARIFRGAGTFPAFLDNLSAFGFVESAYGGYQSAGLLASTGGGLELTAELFLLPATFSAEYHRGLQQNSGGTDDFLFRFLLTGITL